MLSAMRKPQSVVVKHTVKDKTIHIWPSRGKVIQDRDGIRLHMLCFKTKVIEVIYKYNFFHIIYEYNSMSSLPYNFHVVTLILFIRKTIEEQYICYHHEPLTIFSSAVIPSVC